MIKLLAIETATEACSVALTIDNKIHEHFELIPREHSKKLLPMIMALLADVGVSLNQIDAIAFGEGPGAFTGVRIAVSVVQGIAYALNKPVVPVSTLAALAQQALRCHGASQALVAIDARMGQVYRGAFTSVHGFMEPIIESEVIYPEALQVPSSFNDWLGIGSGWHYSNRCCKQATSIVIDAWPHAWDIAVLAKDLVKRGSVLEPSYAQPVYLRNKVALKKSER